MRVPVVQFVILF